MMEMKAKNTILARAQVATSLLLLAATTTASMGVQSSFAISISSSKYSSFHCLQSKIVIDSVHRSGSSTGLSFSTEAIAIAASSSDIAINVKINKLEDKDSSLGFDVKSARGWMEHIEKKEGQWYGVGAYTVIRCDAIKTESKIDWKIRGLEFHMQRLGSSFLALVETIVVPPSDFHLGLDWERESVQRTNNVITALLDHAEMYLMSTEEVKKTYKKDVGTELINRTLMLTILWTPQMNDDMDINKDSRGTIALGRSLNVRGHATFIGSFGKGNSCCDPFPSPISTCLAVPQVPSVEALASLPFRYLDDKRSHPSSSQKHIGSHAKISSWCRMRRPLEDLFKCDGVGEVLLVGYGTNAVTENFIESLEILEGLTSNVFIVCKDGTVKTAPSKKVLHGYARHLVIEEIREIHGLTLDESNAPLVKEANDWSEVFITSAVRLIIPVNRVLLPPVGERQVMTLWEAQNVKSDYARFGELIWTRINKKLLA